MFAVQVTNPLANESDYNRSLEILVDTLMKRRDTVPIALQFLAHKIQSPQELEALRALQVLECLVSRCDSKFTSEVAKFKFLNELIKVVSPKVILIARYLQCFIFLTPELASLCNNSIKCFHRHLYFNTSSLFT